MLGLKNTVDKGRERLIERWLLAPWSMLFPPNDMTFAEIDAALDRIQDRVAECRRIYPYTKPTE